MTYAPVPDATTPASLMRADPTPSPSSSTKQDTRPSQLSSNAAA
jgi:hypothetical protein